MTHTYTLHRLQRVQRPLAEVFAFFSDAGNLERITPESLRFEILTPRPIAMRADAVIDYRLRLCGVSFHWRTVIESFEPMRGFVDRQAKGPYKFWRHTHEFQEVDGGTLVVDRVEYQMPFGLLGRLVHAVFVRRQLEAIFDHRARRIAKLLPDVEPALDTALDWPR
jgi:ligand-binding SRPBCC domain-containing protein